MLSDHRRHTTRTQRHRSRGIAALATAVAVFSALAVTAPPAGATPNASWEWSAPVVSTKPLARQEHVMAYDVARSKTVLFGGEKKCFSPCTVAQLNDTWTFDGIKWTQVNTATGAVKPPVRSGAAMAYDPRNGGKVVMFGGTGSADNLNDTWLWDGTTWTQPVDPTPLDNPTKFGNPQMVFDAARNEVVLFGPLLSPEGYGPPQTWTWSGTDWTNEQVAPEFSPRFSTNPPTDTQWSYQSAVAMAYDAAPARSEVVIVTHSGFALDSPMDTWAWDGTKWTKKNPTTKPSYRQNTAMAYNEATSTVVMFAGWAEFYIAGGCDGDTGYRCDTLTWNGTNWVEETQEAHPSERQQHTMVYDSGNARMVMFGGFGSGSNFLNDTWLYKNPATQPGKIPIYVTDVSIPEGDAGTATPGDFTVSLGWPVPDGQTVTVTHAIADGTATAADNDYTAPTTPPSGVLTFNAGQQSKTVTVDITGDAKHEANQTIKLNLSAPSANAVIADTLGQATILDEEGQLSISVDDVSVVEGPAGANATATFTVALSDRLAAGETASVKAATGAGVAPAATATTDYTTKAATTLAFTNPTTGLPTRTFAVTVKGDGIIDQASGLDETFKVLLTVPVNAVLADTFGLGTILDDDDGSTNPAPVSVSVNDVNVVEGDRVLPNGSTHTDANFTVSLSRALTVGETVSVDFATQAVTATADFTARTTTTLTFDAVTGPSQTVTVQVLKDDRPENNETFKLNLTMNTPGTNIPAVLADTFGLATILDDEGPYYFYVRDFSLMEGTAPTGGTCTRVAEFTVLLSQTPTSAPFSGASEPVVVKVATANGTASTVAPADYTAKALTTLTFKFDTGTTQTVTTTVNCDSNIEPNEDFKLNLSAQSTGAVLADKLGLTTIVTDD